MIITTHAIQRYQERIANVPDDQARAAMNTHATRTAIAFGAPFVKLGSGHRIVIDGDTLVTVLPPQGCGLPS